MRTSDLLDGYWEEGYHYYLEFRGKKLTVRDYRRSVIIETTVKYDAKRLESGLRTVIELADNVLSRTASGDMMMEIRELAYENGTLEMLEYYTILGEKHYTLEKADHGPFDHIMIRDREFLKSIQGVWKRWSPDGSDSELVIRGNTLRFPFERPCRFHVVSYKYSPNSVYLVPENLIDGNFPGYTSVEVLPDMLTTRMIIMDASVPLTIFVREEKLGEIDIPPAALEPIRNTMVFPSEPSERTPED
ncbi:MAG: hypothetical protein J5794_04695 [Lachnospiraceae bacterium]|nr:hypothetical protein [Lachnospiraceae bacterium]